MNNHLQKIKDVLRASMLNSIGGFSMKEGLFIYRGKEIICDLRGNHHLIDSKFSYLILKDANIEGDYFTNSISKDLGDFLQSKIPADVWTHLTDSAEWVEAEYITRFIGALVIKGHEEVLFDGPWHTGEFNGDDHSARQLRLFVSKAIFYPGISFSSKELSGLKG